MKPCPLRYGVSVFRTSLYSSKYTPGDDEESRGQNGSEDGGDEPGDDDGSETLAEGEGVRHLVPGHTISTAVDQTEAQHRSNCRQEHQQHQQQ